MKTVDFSETIAASELKAARFRQLIEFMKLCEYRRSRSFLYHIFSRFCMFCALLAKISGERLQDYWSSGYTLAHEDNFHLHVYPRSMAICKQLLNHCRKLARIHHYVAEFTKCSGSLPSILIVDNCIFLTFRRQVSLCS